MRALLASLALVVIAVAAGPPPVDASCSQSRIDIAVVPMIFGDRVPIGWRVVPECDVIETGLLVGVDPMSLVPIGQAVYGARPDYRHEITVGKTGKYWVAAYARDEDGAIIRSPTRAVFAAVPPSGTRPHGSHGPPPSYTATDEDFLRQAGVPHFASMKALRMEAFDLSTEAPFGAFAPFSGSVSRSIGSTQRGAVSDAQGDAFSLAGSTFSTSAGEVQGAYDTLDQNFAASGFPRPGLSLVTCGVGVDRGVFSPVSCSPDMAAWRTDLSTGLEYRQGLSQESTIFRQFTGELRTRSTVTYFIPRAEPGQQLLSARLVASALFFTTDATQALLGGKRPIDVPGDCTDPTFCTGLATWDFTPEATALAAGGGGPLTLTVGPIPPGLDITDTSFGFFHNDDAILSLLLDVDYPWSHGGEIGGLTLAFQQTCPKQLRVTASPGAVRPVIPAGNTMPNAVAAAPTSAVVDVFVQTCPPGGTSPATVDVALEVRSPAPGTADAAGHLHDSRPANMWGTLARGAAVVTGCTVAIDGDGNGRCTLTYRPSPASGVETIVATAADFAEARTTVRVAVPGLVDLAAVFTNFFRLTGSIPGRHTDVHWGTLMTTNNIQRLALDFFEAFEATLGINDLSLPAGGIFDLGGTWSPPHSWHRTGTSVDIDPRACFDPAVTGACSQTIPVQKRFIGEKCDQYGGGFLAREAQIHCEYPQ